MVEWADGWANANALFLYLAARIRDKNVRRDMRCSLIRACFRFRYLLEEVARTDCDDKGLADVKKM